MANPTPTKTSTPTPKKKNPFPDNQGVNSATVQCPNNKNTREPCDVEKMTIEDKTSKRSLSWDKKLTKDQIPTETPERIAKLLKKYDVVLELMADYETTKITIDKKNDKTVKKIANLVLDSKMIGTCPIGAHSLVKMQALNPVDNGENKTWINVSKPSVEIMARSIAGDKGGAAKWLQPFWMFADEVKEFVVEVESCGVRKSGDINKNLTGLVRIYRNDKFSLNFKFPSFKEYSREWSKNDTGLKESTKKNKYESKTWGRTTYENSNTSVVNESTGKNIQTHTQGKMIGETYYKAEKSMGDKSFDESANKRVITKETRTDSIAMSRSSAVQYDHNKQELTDKAMPQQIRPTIVLKRNDHEVEISKTLNSLIKLQHDLTKAFNSIDKWVPQAGGKVTISISVFTGEIEGEWGNRIIENNSHPRYQVVESYLDLSFKLKVFEYSVDISVGLDVSSPAFMNWFGEKLFEMVVKAGIKLSGEGTITSKVKITSRKPEIQKIKLEQDNKMDAYLVGKVTLAGKTLEAKGGLTTGIKFEGDLLVGLKTPPQIDGAWVLLPGKIYCYYYNEFSGTSSDEPYEMNVFDGGEIYKGKWPEISSNP